MKKLKFSFQNPPVQRNFAKQFPIQNLSVQGPPTYKKKPLTLKQFPIQKTPAKGHTTKKFSIQKRPAYMYPAQRFPVQKLLVQKFPTHKCSSPKISIQIVILVVILTLILAVTLGWSPQLFASTPRTEALNALQTLLANNHKVLTQIDKQLYTETHKKHRTINQPNNPSLNQFENQVQALLRKRREYRLRQDFLDRLRFQIDNRYHGGNLRTFLITRLKKMTLIEIQSEQHSMWKFLKYLTVALENLPEPNENPIEFIEGYLRKSSVIHPITPYTYNQSRNYSNGIDNEAAHPMEPEKVGELVEKKMEELQPPKSQQTQLEPSPTNPEEPKKMVPAINQEHHKLTPDSVHKGYNEEELSISATNSEKQALPETEEAEINLPETEEAEINLPETEEAEINLPETEEAEINLPETEEAEINLPETEEAEINLPETEEAEINLPETEEAEINLPETETNDTNASNDTNTPFDFDNDDFQIKLRKKRTH